MKFIKVLLIFSIILLLFSCVAKKNLEWGWYHYDRGDACKGGKFFKKAALQGDAEAIYMMAYVQEHGECHTKNLENALTLYTTAASKGYLKAQVKTGEIYYQGDWVKRDYKKAGYWYEKAAEQGDAYSQYVAGYMYVNGQGTKKNYIQGVKWLQLSVE